MTDSKGFYTLKGYQEQTVKELTATMEDYLEMICRLMDDQVVVRMGEIANMLHVRPSSVSKMMNQLRLNGYIRAEKYGYILLTEKGREAGSYLLYRHNTIERFLRALNHSDSELEQVEKIEHFLNKKTIKNLQELTNLLEQLNED